MKRKIPTNIPNRPLHLFIGKIKYAESIGKVPLAQNLR